MNTLNFCRDFLASHHPKSIIFCSDNQDEREQCDAASMRLSFSNVDIGERPSVIRVYDGNNSMTLYDVKGVEIDDKSSPIGTILHVVCGSENCDHRYTFILKQKTL